MKIDKHIGRRMGKFYISDELIKNQYETVNRVLSHVVTIECTHHYYSNQFEYIAISPLFEVVEDGCKFNEYKVLITDDEIKFEKLEGC